MSYISYYSATDSWVAKCMAAPLDYVELCKFQHGVLELCFFRSKEIISASLVPHRLRGAEQITFLI